MPVAAVPVVVALVMLFFSILVLATSFVLILGARPDCHRCNKRGTQEKHSQETQDTMHVVSLLGTSIRAGFSFWRSATGNVKRVLGQHCRNRADAALQPAHVSQLSFGYDVAVRSRGVAQW